MAVINGGFDASADVATTGIRANDGAQLQERLARLSTGMRNAHIARHHDREKMQAGERIDLVVEDATAFLDLSPRAACSQCGARRGSEVDGWVLSGARMFYRANGVQANTSKWRHGCREADD